MKKELSTKYNPKDFEKRIYEKWIEKKCFRADSNSTKKPFTLMMPPPNITGVLHIGHAATMSIQDCIVRYKRMRGYETLYLPGTDHASIATEVKVVEALLKETGKTKYEVGRDAFLERAWKWKEDNGSHITKQLKVLGISCDWDKERFTMEDDLNNAVNEFFIKLYNDGQIYKGNRLINWCCDCQTTLSDAEVEHEDKSGNYYYVNYKYVNRAGHITIATSRPETIFADVAIAVHPDDDRYKDLIGELVYIPTTDVKIPIIADEYPDPEKGTGAVKMTPSHDFNDNEVGQRHNLENKVCIDLKGKMTELAGKYEGQTTIECRKKFIKDLDEAGLLEKIEQVQIPTGQCYRCDSVIEPMLSEQWFVKMDDLIKPVLKAIEDNELNVYPEKFKKVHLHWLNNIKDWCISRQLWWGHRIPAYYCEDCNEIIVSKNEPKKCTKCNSTNFRRDEDVLDTWFSSALWTFSTLGWPENTQDLKYFHPTDALVTGYDILFFWVIRMLIASYYAVGELPFKNVIYNGLVRDGEGKKMSKSSGNGIDPIEVINNYGADALRFTLLNGMSPGSDIKLNIEKIESNRNFANKIWNASRFILMNITEDIKIRNISHKDEDLTMIDKWILSRSNSVAKEVNDNFDNFDIAIASGKIYEHIWNDLCNWYIEAVKPVLYSEDFKAKTRVVSILVNILKRALKMLHPYMPFLTDEIYSHLGNDDELILSEYPEYCNAFNFEKEEDIMSDIITIIRGIRNIRVENNVAPSKKINISVLLKSNDFIRPNEELIKTLSNVESINYITDKKEVNDNDVSIIQDKVEIYLALNDIINIEEEKAKLNKELKKIESEIKRAEGKLNNKGFTDKAPEKLIEEEKAKVQKYNEMYNAVKERLKSIGV